MTIRMRLYILLLCLPLVGWASAQPQKAREAFASGDYAEALRLYQVQLTAEGEQPDATTLYNMGVCYTHMEQIAEAVVAYERALYLEPTHREARHNLGLLYATGVKGGLGDGKGLMMRWADQVAYMIKLSGWVVVALVSFVFVLLSIGVFLLSRELRTRRILFYTALGLGLVCVLANAAIAHQWYYHRALEDRAVVADEQIVLSATPGSSAEVVTETYEGVPVVILSAESEWLRVRLPNGLQGWLPESALKRILPIHYPKQ